MRIVEFRDILDKKHHRNSRLSTAHFCTLWILASTVRAIKGLNVLSIVAQCSIIIHKFRLHSNALAECYVLTAHVLASNFNNMLVGIWWYVCPGRAQHIKERFPAILHKFGFVDGKSYSVQEPSDVDLQNAECVVQRMVACRANYRFG